MLYQVIVAYLETDSCDNMLLKYPGITDAYEFRMTEDESTDYQAEMCLPALTVERDFIEINVNVV